MPSSARLNPRLRSEASSYLRSAAHQPVDWHPWSPEVFERARREDKPILLDVGAVWCHWCHVMDGESYDDPDLARVINERFVAVKVDRDERPDVDLRYQRLVSALTGAGGWPLTAFLTPEGRVFYGGTYFPPKEGHGRPAFRQILEAVSDAYRARRGEIMQQADQIAAAVRERADAPPPKDPIDEAWLARAVRACIDRHDAANGGWGQAPKFPHPSAVELLLIRHARDPSGEGGAVVQTTLRRMAAGGVYDQVGGGFHRYSTDAAWHVPHFEKMLYDNAELLRNYVLAWRVLRDDTAHRLARDIVRFMDETLSDQRAGGFYGSQDADVRTGDDGDYFTWTMAEVLEAAGGDERLARLLALRYGAEERGPMHHNHAKNVLRVVAEADDLAAVTKRPLVDVQRDLGRGLGLLRAARARREAPFIDRVLYTAWNAMAIRAYFEYAAALDERGAAAFARRTLDRFLAEGYDPATGFRHSLGGKAVAGLLDDNAQMVVALLTAFTHTQDPRYLDAARGVGRLLEREYWEEDLAAFTDTARSTRGREAARPLGQPETPLEDSPSPSANARAAEGLLMLADLTGEAAARAHVARLVDTHAHQALHQGIFRAALLVVADRLVHPAPKIVVAGPSQGGAIDALHRAALAESPPGSTVIVVTDSAAPSGLPPEASAFARGPARRRAGAMVCLGTRCLAPVHDAPSLARILRETGGVQAARPHRG